MTGTGLIAEWRLDEGTGVTAVDTSGNGNIASLVNGPAWTAGRSAQGLSLDGVNDYVTVPHAPRLDAFPLSVAAWFKTTTTEGLRAVVNKYAAGSFNGYQVFFNNGDLCAWLLRSSSNYIYDGGGCTMKATGFNDGQWHQVVFVADASGGRLYVDAVQKASQPWTGPAGAPSTTQELRLGHYPGVTGGDSYLPGLLDEVRVYDRALSAAEVAQIYGEVPSIDGLIAQWRLDEGSGVTTADSSGSGHAGSLVNGAGWTDGRSGRGLSFDGVDDYVSVPHAPALDAFPLSVVAWFKTSTAVGLKGLVNKYAAGSFNGFEVFVENGDLCAWLFRSNSNYIWDGSGCTLRTSGYKRRPLASGGVRGRRGRRPAVCRRGPDGEPALDGARRCVLHAAGRPPGRLPGRDGRGLPARARRRGADLRSGPDRPGGVAAVHRDAASALKWAGAVVTRTTAPATRSVFARHLLSQSPRKL
jgi:hypothetical protein